MYSILYHSSILSYCRTRMAAAVFWLHGRADWSGHQLLKYATESLAANFPTPMHSMPCTQYRACKTPFIIIVRLTPRGLSLVISNTDGVSECPLTQWNTVWTRSHCFLCFFFFFHCIRLLISWDKPSSSRDFAVRCQCFGTGFGFEMSRADCYCIFSTVRKIL